VVTEEDLLTAVDVAFAATGSGFAPWPPPHGDRSPLDVEYSRLTDPGRWRILGGRADAWLRAIAEAQLAEIERDVAARWAVPPRTTVSRVDRATPHGRGALPLLVARSRLGDVDDAGVTIGVGDPATCVTWFPYCGCDACDDGSDDELDQLDRHLRGIVAGEFRLLTSGRRSIMVVGADGWSASDLRRGDDVDAILAEPAGWDEVSGASWFGHGTITRARR